MSELRDSCSCARAPWLVAAGLSLLALWAGQALALSFQAQSVSALPDLATGIPGVAHAPGPNPSESSKSGWAALTPSQREALAPLAVTWNSLSTAHQRKWLALSENFSRLPPQEQQMLHGRMREWASMSTRQRAQARLNFGETKQLSAADKKAMWEAYQALPPEEKKKLAADAQPRPPTTAAAIRPVPRQKLATLPKPAAEARAPRIAAGPAIEAASPDAGSSRAFGAAAQQNQ